jgi:hypothetical protein
MGWCLITSSVREGGHHLGDHLAHVVVWRVLGELRVVVDLQCEQVPALAEHGTGQIRQYMALGPGIAQLADAAAGPPQGLYRGMEIAVVHVMRIAPTQREGGDGIRDGIPGHAGKTLACVTRPCQARMRRLAIEIGFARQRGVAVHAAHLQRHVVGADVALFEDKHPHAHLPGHLDGAAVHGPGLAKQHDRVDALVQQQAPQPGHPFIDRVGVTKGIASAIEEFVPTIELDLAYPQTLLDQIIRQPAEEWAHRTLQQQRPPARDERGERIRVHLRVFRCSFDLRSLLRFFWVRS